MRDVNRSMSGVYRFGLILAIPLSLAMGIVGLVRGDRGLAVGCFVAGILGLIALLVGTKMANRRWKER